MAIPKGAKYGNKVFTTPTGNKRVDDLLFDTDPKTTYLPEGIEIIDLDTQILEEITKGRLSTISASKKQTIPTFMLGAEKWGEFAKTWQLTDNDKNIEFPVITLRKTDTKYGTRLGEERYFNSNINTYQYKKIPTMDNIGRIGYEIYKVPNPTPIDIIYEIRLFSHFMEDVNRFDENFIRKFQDGQYYIKIKGNYMPVFLESNGEDNVLDIDKNNYYVRYYNIILKGFILNIQDFQTIKATDRIVNIVEINTKKWSSKETIPKAGSSNSEDNSGGNGEDNGNGNGEEEIENNEEEYDFSDMKKVIEIIPNSSTVMKETTGKVLTFKNATFSSDVINFGSDPTNVIYVKDSKNISFSKGFMWEFVLKLNTTQSDSEESLALKAGSCCYGINSGKLKTSSVSFPTVSVVTTSGSQKTYYPVESNATTGNRKIPIGKYVTIRLGYDEDLGAMATSIDGVIDTVRYINNTGKTLNYNNTYSFQLFKGLINFNLKSAILYTGKPNLNIPLIDMFGQNIKGNSQILITLDHIEPGILPCEVGITLQNPNASTSVLSDSISNFTLSSSGKTDIQFNMPVDIAGLYTAQIAISKAGKEVKSKEIKIVNKSATTNQVYSINANKQYCKNGTPFFPLLAYHVKGSDMALVKSFGFNMVHSDFNIINNSGGFQANLRAYLNSAATNNIGMTVVANYYAAKVGNLALLTGATDVDVVSGYYSADEPFGFLGKLNDSYNGLKQYNPDVPIIVNMNNFLRLQEAAAGCDVLLVDPYPIPDISLRMIYDTVKKGISAVSNLKPVWCIIPQYEQKIPSLTELKCMAWLAIAAGANGIGLFEMDHSSNGVGWKMYDYPTLTANTSSVFNEIAGYESMILLNNHATQPTSTNIAVHVLKKSDNTLIIVNDSRGTETAVIGSTTYTMSPHEVRII